jgi:hypothetical protein
MRARYAYGGEYFMLTWDQNLLYTICLLDPATSLCPTITNGYFYFKAINVDLTNPSSNTLCYTTNGNPRAGFSMFFYINNSDPEILDYQYIDSGGSNMLVSNLQISSPTPILSTILGSGTFSNLISSCKDTNGNNTNLPFDYAVLCSYQVIKDGVSQFFLGVNHLSVDTGGNISNVYSTYFSDYLDANKGYSDYFNRRTIRLLCCGFLYAFVTLDRPSNTFYVTYTNQDSSISNTYTPYTFTSTNTILSYGYDYSNWNRFVIVAVTLDINDGVTEYLEFWFFTVCGYNNVTGYFDNLLTPPINIITAQISHFDPGNHEFSMLKFRYTSSSYYILMSMHSTNTAIYDYSNDVVTLFKIVPHGNYVVFDIMFTYDNVVIWAPVIYGDKYFIYGYAYQTDGLGNPIFVNGVWQLTGLCLFRKANAYNTTDDSRCRDWCLFYEKYNVATQTCERCLPTEYLDATTLTCVTNCNTSDPYLVIDPVLKTCYYCTAKSLKFENGTCVVACSANYIDNGATCDLCPLGQFKSGAGCVAVCPFPTGGNAVTRTCVTCVAPSLYWYNGGCYSTCPIGLGADATNTCINCSTINQKLYNSKCYPTCPANTYLLNATCLDSCPDNYGTNKTTYTCDLCSAINKIYYQGECITSCPNDYGLTSLNTCIDCYAELKAYVELGKCVSKCSINNGINKSNYSCINCATNSLYNYNGICTPIGELPLGFKVIDNTYNIVNSCKSLQLYIFEAKCVSICPDGTKLTSSTNTCDSVNLCSEGSININSNCVSCLSMSQVYSNKQCVLSCPAGQNADSSGVCREPLICTPKYKYNGECMTECPEGMISDSVSYTCVNCGQNGKIKFEESCVIACPDTYNNVNGTCENCSGDNTFIYKSQCISVCPAGTIKNKLSCVQSKCTDIACNGGSCSISFNSINCLCQEDKLGVYCLHEAETIDEVMNSYSIYVLTIDSRIQELRNMKSIDQTAEYMVDDLMAIISQMPSLVDTELSLDIYSLAGNKFII